MAIRHRKDGRWIVYYRAKDGSGKLIEENMGRGPEGEAAAIARNAELNLAYRKPQKPRRTSGTLFEDLAQAYVETKNFADNPLKHLIIRLQSNILPFFGVRDADTLTFADMTRYVRHRQSQGVKNSTIRREITDIKAILNWSVRQHPPLIPRNPVRDFEKPPDDDAVIYPPTREELARIQAAAPEHLKRVIRISYYTGLRPGAVELLTLTWGAIDWEQRVFRIMSAHKGGPIRREVPIFDAFLPELRDWYAADRPLFAAMDTAPIIHYKGKTIKKIQTVWENTLKRAGITRRLRPYDLRHQFITRVLEQGADLKTVSEIVGSSPKTILRHYQHVSNRLRRGVIASMDPIPEPDPEK